MRYHNVGSTRQLCIRIKDVKSMSCGENIKGTLPYSETHAWFASLIGSELTRILCETVFLINGLCNDKSRSGVLKCPACARFALEGLWKTILNQILPVSFMLAEAISSSNVNPLEQTIGANPASSHHCCCKGASIKLLLDNACMRDWIAAGATGMQHIVECEDNVSIRIAKNLSAILFQLIYHLDCTG